jgi:excisionase family DNA binding protein
MEGAAMGVKTSAKATQHDIFHDYPDVVNHNDLCVMLGISKNTAYNLLRAGKIKSRRIWKIYKIPKQEVIGFLSQNS